MYLLNSSPTVIPCFHTRKSKTHQLLFKSFNYIRHPPSCVRKVVCPVFRNKNQSISAVASRDYGDAIDGLFDDDDDSITIDLTELEEDDDESSPWEGAITYQRNASISHVEYCTTLERLGLAKVSSEVSKSQAFAMGLRVSKAVKDFPLGTPVLVSVDVTKKKKRLRLDGIIKTVITLGCNRCGEPTGEGIFSNFSLLLLEDPIEEEEDDITNIGTIFGEDKFKSYGKNSNKNEEEDEEDAVIDIDDRLYFPPEEKTIDISKNIRDMVHIEITINSVCSPQCKGLCLQCGKNLNITACICDKREKKEKGYGPLRDLRSQMQQS
ncbi:large ribosomal RNA subunit accumulation protein YCED homolog 1, chloroplastic [Impatiens glandulifera]|uniref:large ribosomal RNA subunit accumulation protein YCED homolog 1, chloroplastic n=1 Tax=Impatiens glandulifera TaxID=253017 RepID=UPI001FB17371|nr:large ribosomal RNA subunit accumulation protein YCED homolog 1, chloroplastic [Impatiens glandulifera]